MAVFTQAELQKALAGAIDDLTADEYDVCETFARAKLMAYLGNQYADTFDSNEVVRKELALELGVCRAMWFRFSEERLPQSLTTLRFNTAIDTLKAFNKKELRADAASVEPTRQPVAISTLKKSDGVTDIDTPFTDDNMENW